MLLNNASEYSLTCLSVQFNMPLGELKHVFQIPRSYVKVFFTAIIHVIARLLSCYVKGMYKGDVVDNV